MKYKFNKKLIIFGFIGLFNTVFDLALYVMFNHLTGSIVLANIISTSAALIGSYLLNSKLTFKHNTWTLKVFLYFMIVTLFGLWVLQTGLIVIITAVLKQLPNGYLNFFHGFRGTAKLLIPKIIATLVTLTWNYVCYSRLVFSDNKVKNDELDSLRLAIAFQALNL